KRPVLRQLVHCVIAGIAQILLDIRIIILTGTLRQPVPGLYLEQPAIIAVGSRRHNPVPAPGPGVRLAVRLVVETDSDPVQGAWPDIPVELVPEKQFRLIVGLPEGCGLILVVHLPERLLGVAEPESGPLIEEAGQ